jgi:hypothetical protein
MRRQHDIQSREPRAGECRTDTAAPGTGSRLTLSKPLTFGASTSWPAPASQFAPWRRSSPRRQAGRGTRPSCIASSAGRSTSRTAQAGSSIHGSGTEPAPPSRSDAEQPRHRWGLPSLSSPLDSAGCGCRNAGVARVGGGEWGPGASLAYDLPLGVVPLEGGVDVVAQREGDLRGALDDPSGAGHRSHRLERGDDLVRAHSGGKRM